MRGEDEVEIFSGSHFKNNIYRTTEQPLQIAWFYPEAMTLLPTVTEGQIYTIIRV